MRRSVGLLAIIALILLLVEASVLPPTEGAAAVSPRVAAPAVAPQAAPPCPPRDPALLFPPQMVNILAFDPWGFPAYSGDKALEPLPDSFDIVERPAWFDGIPVTIRPFPRPSVGDGGPDDNHADMYVFFYPDGRPVAQPPMLEVVPHNAVPPVANPTPAQVALAEIEARLFSANWEVHVVRVPENYQPGSIKTSLDLLNPQFVLEDIQTNIFVTFPILPRQSTIPGLELNGLSVQMGTIEGKLVSFVEYDIWDNEYTKKPMYAFRKPDGTFAGNPVLSGLPGMPHISSLWEVFIVEVPANYVADTLKSEDDVLASTYQIRDGFEVFAPVESVDGMRTVFDDFMDILTEPDGRFHKVRFPKHEGFPAQPWFNDSRLSAATLGFTDRFNNFNFNEVESPRLQRAPAPADAVAEALAEALGGGAVNGCGPVILPPAVARQRLIEDADGNLTHLSQAAVDNMPLDEVISRGQALFEREFRESEGAGPALNAYSCATCHGLPFIGGVEPTAGGPGVRFRNALQPTESGLKTSHNTPHVFGSGVLTQLGKELGADGSDAKPFPHHWKGLVPSIRAFTAGALKGELGIESVEKVAEIAGVSIAEAATRDPDRDGKVAEVTVGDVTALTVFQQSLPRPYQINASDSKVIKGRQVFESVGCAACHTPVQTLRSTILELTNPETDGVVRIPLGSPTVELFSDLKRHKMGSLLAEPGAQDGIPADVFKTKELWGVGDSSPYLHDASADTLEEAIARHGGAGSEALPAVTAFNALSGGDRGDLIRFLKSLVLPRPRDLEVAAFNRLTDNDRAILGPFLPSLLQGLPQAPLLVAWIVDPPPEGSGKVKGQTTVRVSITAEDHFDQAFLVVDGNTILPLAYNFATGFHEAALNTTTLSEGYHVLALDLRTSGSTDDRQRVVNTAVITVDNIPDDSPSNFPSGFVGPQCVR